MRTILRRLWMSLSGRSLTSPKRTPARHRGRFFQPERLEDRVALTGFAGVSPAGCTCPNCCGPAAYTLGGGVPGSSPYALKWPQPAGLGKLTTITYSYSNLLNGQLGGGLGAVTIRAVVREAFSRWAAVAPLRFVEVRDVGPAPSAADYDATGKPMIRLGHRPIDGAYGVLAYGYYPGDSGLSGDVQFDTGERWTVNPATGQDLLEVATHEIGHALGLGHSTAATSVMRASYSGYFNGLGTSKLFADDVAGIRALYGAGVGSVTPLATTTTPPPVAISPFILTGTTLYVIGTAGNDVFTFTGGATPSVTMNGARFAGNLRNVRSVIFTAYGGNDQANVVGTSRPETFVLHPGTLTMTGATWNVSVTGCETIDVTGGVGDVVKLTGTAGADTYASSPTMGRLAGSGYSLVVRGGSNVVVTGGGGLDTATLQGSAGNDGLTGGPASVRLAGPGFSHTVVGFRNVTAAGLGGFDQARLSDSAGNDLFVAALGSAKLQGIAYQIVATGFERVQAFASAGVDVARLTGTTGADTLIAAATFSALEGDIFRFEATQFDQVYADGQGGADEAYLYDSLAGDTFTGQGPTGTLRYPGAVVQFTNFAQAALYGTGGGVNRRMVSGLTFAVDWVGSWV